MNEEIKEKALELYQQNWKYKDKLPILTESDIQDFKNITDELHDGTFFKDGTLPGNISNFFVCSHL